ncbi:MAG: nucleotidyltransferase family protein [Candidatus Omnitrophica bacterium]|nr:nucleotidyltransferase family protein [Candidatus Omnitrophota bacterium]
MMPLVQECRYQQASRNLFLLSQFDEVCRSFSRETIEFMPLKGIAFLGTLYDDFSRRFIGDMDILVKPCDCTRAVSLLTALGYVPAGFCFDPRRPCSMYLNSAALAAPGEIQYTLHLHWHLLNSTWPMFMFRVDMQELWRGSRHSPGVPYRIMDPHHLLVYLCLHAFNHGFDGRHLVEDILRANNFYRGSLSAERVAQVAGAWNARLPVFMGLSLAALQAPDDEDLRRIRGLVAPGDMSRGAQGHFDSLMRTGKAGEIAMALFFLEILAQPKQKIKFILLSLFPPLASSNGITWGKACMRLVSFAARLAGGFLRRTTSFLLSVC